MDPVRIFNLNGKTYKYERTLNAEECTSIKTLSVLEKNKDYVESQIHKEKVSYEEFKDYFLKNHSKKQSKIRW